MNRLKISGSDLKKSKKTSILKRYYKKCFLFLIIVFIFGAILNYYLLDGLAGLLGSSFLGDDTLYTSGYTDKLFRKIKPGMTKNEMLLMLGYPFEVVSEYVMYKESSWSNIYVVYKNNIVAKIAGNIEIFNEEDKIVSDEFSIENYKKIKEGMTKHEVISLIGYPLNEFYKYSLARHGYSYRRRGVVIMNNIVVRKISEFYFD